MEHELMRLDPCWKKRKRNPFANGNIGTLCALVDDQPTQSLVFLNELGLRRRRGL
jgi:hypothetical protein